MVGDAGTSHGSGDVGRQPTVGQNQRSSYASATGQASSYARVHGEVSREPADWTAIPSVARETLDDVRYQKAEGIAKARGAAVIVCAPVHSGSATLRSQGTPIIRLEQSRIAMRETWLVLSICMVLHRSP